MGHNPSCLFVVVVGFLWSYFSLCVCVFFFPSPLQFYLNVVFGIVVLKGCYFPNSFCVFKNFNSVGKNNLQPQYDYHFGGVLF